MENKVNYRPANKVRTAKGIIITIGVLCLLATFPLLMEGFEGWSAIVVLGLIFLLSGGILEGLAAIVSAACEYSWEFEQRHAEKPEERIDDSEVQ